MAKEEFKMDMCDGPILSKMLRFSLPLMLSSVLQLLFNAADVVVVGQFAGDNSLGAVGCTGSLVNLLVNLFIGLSVGANVMAARHFGAKQEDRLSKTVHTSMVISIVSGLILTIVGIVFARDLLELMDTPPEQLDLAALYLRIYFGGMIANLIYNFGSALLRAVGDTKRPMFYLSISGVVNVVLNLIFVIVFKMDVAGVAIATVISQCISAFLVVRCLMNETGGIRLELRKISFDLKEFVEIIKVGLPAGIQGCIFSLSNVIIQSSVNGFGNIVVSGNSAALNLEGFVYVSMNAFHHATLSFMSQNYGAGRTDRMKKILLSGILCVTVAGAVFGNLEVLFGKQLLHIYSNNPEIVAAGQTRLLYICTLYFTCGLMDVMVGALRGLGYSVMPMIVSLAGVCGVRLIWIATVFAMPQYHMVESVYISYPISWIVTFLIHLACFFVVRKRAMKRCINRLTA